MSTLPGLLSGIVVADFGWAVAGPCLSRFLAHHGADVIKIESNSRLDPTRMSPPFATKPHRNGSGYFDHHNAGKRSITLNLKHPEGRRLALELAVRADVVNENFAPGVLDDLGIGYDAMRAVRPDVILVSSSTQGQTGPNARHPGLGVTLQGLVGLCDLTGWPDREPVGTGEPYTDTFVPWIAGLALVAMLDYRRRTGTGAHVDLSQFEAVAHALSPALIHGQLTGTRHSRNGNRGHGMAPEGVYPCVGEERWCAISIATDDQWQSLSRIVGFRDSTPTEAQDLGWRMTHHNEIDAAIAAWTSSRDAVVVEMTLQQQGVPASQVARSCDLLEDDQLRWREHWIALDHPVMGVHSYRMPPFRLKEHAVVVERSPLIGEHTDAVLQEILGISDNEIRELRDAGALA